MTIQYPPKEFWKHFKEANGAMSSAEAIFLYNVCLQVPEEGVLVEAGTAYGKSALVSLMAWVERKDNYFYLLEPQFENPEFYKEAALNIANFKEKFGGDTKCDFTAEYSTDFLPKFYGYSYIFWDSGSHGSELVSLEKPIIESRMMSGGILAMHDVFSQFTACTEAYYELIRSGNFEPIEYDWKEINGYVKENSLDDCNRSWHQYPELPHSPNFIGALRRK